MIENVQGILNTFVEADEKKIKIVDYIKNELKCLGYFINYCIVDTADYGTPQTRKRAIFLISKNGFWQFPQKSKKITVKEAIGNLPSLESGEKSDIKYHYAKNHNDRHIFFLKHTPTGKTALQNTIHYPKKENGERIKGYATTYKRIEWNSLHQL